MVKRGHTRWLLLIFKWLSLQLPMRWLMDLFFLRLSKNKILQIPFDS
jgi:hypothetical protein